LLPLFCPNGWCTAISSGDYFLTDLILKNGQQIIYLKKTSSLMALISVLCYGPSFYRNCNCALLFFKVAPKRFLETSNRLS